MAEEPKFSDKLSEAIDKASGALAKMVVAQMIVEGVQNDKIVINAKGDMEALEFNNGIAHAEYAARHKQLWTDDKAAVLKNGLIKLAKDQLQEGRKENDLINQYDDLVTRSDKVAARIEQNAKILMAKRLNDGTEHPLINKDEQAKLKEGFGDLYKKEPDPGEKDKKEAPAKDGTSAMPKELQMVVANLDYQSGYNPRSPVKVAAADTPALTASGSEKYM